MHRLLTTVTILSLLFAVSPVLAKKGKDKHAEDPQAMMELWKKLGTPGAPHQQLASLLDDDDQGVDGTGEAPHRGDRHRGNENVAGRTLSPTRIQQYHDGPTVHRDRDHRL